MIRLSELRKENGLSQKDFGKIIGAAQNTVSQWENGSREPDNETITRIANFFNVSTDYLLGKNTDEVFDIEYIDEYDGFNHIGEYLKESRENRNLTLDDLSSEIGIPKKILSDYEKEITPVKSNVFYKILNYYGITQLGFEDEHGILEYEAHPPFNGDYNASYAFDKAVESDHYNELIDHIDLNNLHRIPILGYISAGLPIYAEQHIEGYTYTDLNSGGEYFGLRVKGDSMNALRICEGDIIIVKKQDYVENGEIAVVMVDNENATVKQFYRKDDTVTLIPKSTNPKHKPQFYNLKNTTVKIIGKVVRNQIDF